VTDLLHLKLLDLFLDTIIIGHKLCYMLSILNELTLQKEIHNFVTDNVFRTKKAKPQQQQQNIKLNIKIIARTGFEPGTSCIQGECVTFGPPSQMELQIAMRRNVNKQPNLRASHFQQIHTFL